MSHTFFKSICSSVTSANLPINTVGYTLFVSLAKLLHGVKVGNATSETEREREMDGGRGGKKDRRWMGMGCGSAGWINRVLKSRKTMDLWFTGTENSRDCINIMILQQLR